MTVPHTNRLAREKSPYLLQHAHNPVDWFAWREEAFARARAENKPVFLSIGYATCHWCHVMERESFEDETIGAFLKAHFISIKVDREERPDVDKIYMTFVQSTTGGGGWPLNVFLTPERKPFFGGTYFPPAARPGYPSFLGLLQQVAELWRERKSEIVASAEELQARLELLTARDAPINLPLTPQTLRHAAQEFQAAYDPANGGFGGAPKFPQPAIPALVLRAAQRFGDAAAVKMVLHTCDAMAAGGLHDQLGGGFSRYAVDAEWGVPHFEKMLYDNAQLAQLYLDAFLVSGEGRHAEVARDILDYVLRDLTHPDGGFYSAEDADSEGHEGKFYCWTQAELAKLLSPEEFIVAANYFGITKDGNFVDHSHPAPLPGQNVLRAANPEVPPADVPLLAAAQAKMRTARARRLRPPLDDKILASWNGLMLGALARAAMVLDEEKYLAAAERNLQFIREKLWVPPAGGTSVPASQPGRSLAPPKAAGTLFHRWREGERDQVELLEDYAFQLDGVIQLHEATLAPPPLAFALELAEAMMAKFYDPAHGGFWQSRAGAADLILRVKDDYDGAEPSGNSVATLALLKLAALTGRDDFQQAAEATLQLAAQRLQSQPAAHATLLHALDFWLDEPCRVTLTGDTQAPEFHNLLHAAHSVYRPNTIIAGHADAVGIPPAPGKVTAQVCTGQTCQAPTHDAEQLRQQLRR